MDRWWLSINQIKDPNHCVYFRSKAHRSEENSSQESELQNLCRSKYATCTVRLQNQSSSSFLAVSWGAKKCILMRLLCVLFIRLPCRTVLTTLSRRWINSTAVLQPTPEPAVPFRGQINPQRAQRGRGLIQIHRLFVSYWITCLPNDETRLVFYLF